MIGCTFNGFPVTQTNRTHKHALLVSRYPGWPEGKTIINKKDFKTKLYMHNTKGDVAPMNISRETSYFHDSVQYPQQKFSKTNNTHLPSFENFDQAKQIAFSVLGVYNIQNHLLSSL